MKADIQTCLDRFLEARHPNARYASFDYCFNYFQQARDDGDIRHLASEDHLPEACLQLGFYLASWGMIRGSSKLLQRSVRGLVPVIKAIAETPLDFWDLDAHLLTSKTQSFLALHQQIQDGFSESNIKASPILTTKVMLGVFGCVPAFDRYFCQGSSCGSFGGKALQRIGEFYEENRTEIDSHSISTFSIRDGRPTERKYTRSKIIDMVFFQKGLQGEPESPTLKSPSAVSDAPKEAVMQATDKLIRVAKYDPLRQYLSTAAPGVIEMTFAEVEQILKSSLPRSARKYDVWWTDKSAGTSHVEARAWLDSGREVESVDLQREVVRFTGVRGRA